MMHHTDNFLSITIFLDYKLFGWSAYRPAVAQEKVPIGLIATILKRWIAIESFETERLSAKIYRLVT